MSDLRTWGKWPTRVIEDLPDLELDAGAGPIEAFVLLLELREQRPLPIEHVQCDFGTVARVKLEATFRRNCSAGIPQRCPTAKVGPHRIVRRPTSTVSNRAMKAAQSIAESIGIQSYSPFGPAMNPSRLMATL